jgi:hypothetical protein
MGYDSIFWLPVCAVLTGAGLVLSYYAGRRRGYTSMLRGVAWSLIPLAAYLTGSVKMLWKIGDAIGNFASGFAFSPERWAGVGVVALAFVLFVVTGGRGRRRAVRERRKAARAGQGQKSAATADTPAGLAPSGALPATSILPATTKQPQPARTAQPAKRSGKSSGPADDDMKDIEEILRNRGL